MDEQESSLIQNFYYYIQQRVTTDWTTDAVMAVILSFITCGIYGFYIFYKLVDRRDQHFARVANMVNSSIVLLKDKAARLGRAELVSQEIAQLEMVQRDIYEQSRERGAALWLVLDIITWGIAGLVAYYFIMDDFARHDQNEAQYFTLMSMTLAKLGLSAQTSQAAPTIPQREFWVFLLLSIVTCGIYSFYWMYVMVNDGNVHFEAQVQWEDYIYSALAAS